jgi:hypothetical protein
MSRRQEIICCPTAVLNIAIFEAANTTFCLSPTRSFYVEISELNAKQKRTNVLC